MLIKPPEKINISGVSKNRLFVNCVHAQHKLKIQKNMEKNYLRYIKGLRGICQIISVFTETGLKISSNENWYLVI